MKKKLFNPANQRYIPHNLNTRYHAVKLYRTGVGVMFVCRRYHISKSSLMRWNRIYDGTKLSLVDRSHRPLSKHPSEHTDIELKWIKDYLRRNPNLSVCELYGKLKSEKGYSRNIYTLYKWMHKLGYLKKVESTKSKKHDKPYFTPIQLGLKWQLDVKYIPSACYVGSMPDKFYQYTMIDEASRERFIYPYKEQSSFSTIDFVKRAIRHFGYAPLVLQTDNGSEFTYTTKTNRVHPLDRLCDRLHIVHKLIRPRTPWHNGKVERSHRNDQERFYNYLHFYDYEDLKKQMKSYLTRSNHIPMQVLGWLSPLEMRKEIESYSDIFCKLV